MKFFDTNRTDNGEGKPLCTCTCYFCLFIFFFIEKKETKKRKTKKFFKKKKKNISLV
jgi:hypothetical protein